MKPILRNAAAIILGLLAGGCVNMAIILVGSQLIPAPDGVDVSSTESMRANVHLFAPRHFFFPFVAHACGTLTGALTAYLVAARLKPVFGYAVGVLNLVGGIAAASMIPAPTWFVVTDLLLAYVPMAWLAVTIGRRLQPVPVSTGGRGGQPA